MPYPHVFAALTGSIPASYLDDDFNAAALATDLAATDAAVAALPSSATPLVPAAVGAAGSSPTLSRDDHQHPVQAPTPNAQTGTSYTVQSSDNGKVIDLTNAGAITVTFPNSLTTTFSCLLCQGGAGQVTFAVAGGGFLRQRQGFTKTAGQYAVVSAYVRTNSGGSAAEYVLAGDMVS